MNLKDCCIESLVRLDNYLEVRFEACVERGDLDRELAYGRMLNRVRQELYQRRKRALLDREDW